MNNKMLMMSGHCLVTTNTLIFNRRAMTYQVNDDEVDLVFRLVSAYLTDRHTVIHPLASSIIASFTFGNPSLVGINKYLFLFKINAFV